MASTGGWARTTPVSDCSTVEVFGTVACRSAQQQVEPLGNVGCFAGAWPWLGTDCDGQHGQQSPAVDEAVALASPKANMQHQPCGNATSRLQAKTRDRTTQLPISKILFGVGGRSSSTRARIVRFPSEWRDPPCVDPALLPVPFRTPWPKCCGPFSAHVGANHLRLNQLYRINLGGFFGAAVALTLLR